MSADDIPLAPPLAPEAVRPALSGLMPTVGIAAGRCFAGNAALLGCCDVIIATENSSIGMGGPAMIEGGGLGKVASEEVGPIAMQVKNGVVDVRARDEAEAVAVAKKYLAFFQGPHAAGVEVAAQTTLRAALPESHRRAPLGAALHGGAAEGLWPRRAGDGGRALSRSTSGGRRSTWLRCWSSMR
jgi:Carboxyl transferase domain